MLVCSFSFDWIVLYLLSYTLIKLDCFGVFQEQQAGVTDEAEPFLGSGRFGTECQALFISHSLIFTKCLLLILFHWIYFSFVLQQIYLLLYFFFTSA